jgi:hypothetical protein
MKNLAKLVGESWLSDVLADTRRRAHPLRFQLTKSGAASVRWRETFEIAVGVVDELLVNDAAARIRLIAKLKDRRQFWSTVPEIVWAARLHRAGMQVEVEPIIGRTGPDIRFTMAGFTAHAEVYAPVFQAAEFDWGEDLQDELERLAVGFHVSAQQLPPRTSENRSIIAKILRRAIGEIASKNDRTEYRLYMRSDRSVRMEPTSGYVTLESDPIMEEEDDLLFVTDLYNRPEQGGITIGTHVTNGHRDHRKLLTDLGQLQPGANLLILDTTRDFITRTSIELSCDGAFARHPELSAIAVSSWGVYPNPLGDDHFVEEYDFIVNPNGATPFSPEMLTVMGQSGLLDSKL